MNEITVEKLIECYDDDNDDDMEILFSSEEDADTSGTDDTRERHVKISNFIETIEKYSERDFKKHFRLNRTTVLDLIAKYQVHTEKEVGPGRPALGPNVDMYMHIWYLSNTVTFRQLGNLFGVAKSTAWNAVVRVSNFYLKIANHYLKWPTHEESKLMAKKFEDMEKVPNIIGAIDGTHIRIKAPLINPVDFCNRKKYYSINVQVVVDAQKKIMDLHCGEPGSMHDARVLRRSALYRKVEENKNQFFPPNTFILGDSAYPQKPWLVPPFKDNGALTDAQHKFNKLHSSTRVVVENAIGMLKSRFRRILHFTEQVDLNLLQKIIYSACVLHNICIMQNDEINSDSNLLDTIVQSEPIEEIINVTGGEINRRQLLLEELIRKNVIHLH